MSVLGHTSVISVKRRNQYVKMISLTCGVKKQTKQKTKKKPTSKHTRNTVIVTKNEQVVARGEMYGERRE